MLRSDDEGARLCSLVDVGVWCGVVCAGAAHRAARRHTPAVRLEHGAARRGALAQGQVPPPEHNHPDRNSELTEIYLRF
jgi:hypothetical protein